MKSLFKRKVFSEGLDFRFSYPKNYDILNGRSYRISWTENGRYRQVTAPTLKQARDARKIIKAEIDENAIIEQFTLENGFIVKTKEIN